MTIRSIGKRLLKYYFGARVSNSVVRQTRALKIALALLQVGQIFRAREKAVAFEVVVALEPFGNRLDSAFDHAGKFQAALLACEPFYGMYIQGRLIGGFSLGIAAHKFPLRCG